MVSYGKEVVKSNVGAHVIHNYLSVPFYRYDAKILVTRI